jgi:hypothetical protein
MGFSALPEIREIHLQIYRRRQLILDPANELWEENEYDTDNSVLWITAPN